MVASMITGCPSFSPERAHALLYEVFCASAYKDTNDGGFAKLFMHDSDFRVTLADADCGAYHTSFPITN